LPGARFRHAAAVALLAALAWPFRSAPDHTTIEDIVDAIFMPLITPNSGGRGEV